MTPFRNRGEQTTRIEVLSDAVFGFSLTLLVVSLEVPRTFDQLMELVYGFFPFALSFILFVHIWYLHNRFFKRYGLEDVPTIWLNSTLLFLVMFFVYPLKFLVNVVVLGMSGGPLTFPGPDGDLVPILTSQDGGPMLILFSAGYIAIHLTFVALYLHAFRIRSRLDLSELEVYDTRSAIVEHLLYVAVGVLSVSMVLIGGARWVPWAGWLYAILGPVMGANGYRNGKKRERLFGELRT